MVSKHCLKILLPLDLELIMPDSKLEGAGVDIFFELCARFTVPHTMVTMLILTSKVDDRSGLLLLLLIVIMRANFCGGRSDLFATK
jgi:hypothetical protein